MAKTEEAKTVYMPLATLLEAQWENNPKAHSIEKLVDSMKKFGFVTPPMIDSRNGRLVAGHGRVLTLQALQDDGEPPPRGISLKDGDWLVPVNTHRFKNDKEADAYTIADNAHTMNSGWDEKLLHETLITLNGAFTAAELGFESLGLEPELNRLGADEEDTGKDADDDDDAPAEDAQPAFKHTCPSCGHRFNKSGTHE